MGIYHAGHLVQLPPRLHHVANIAHNFKDCGSPLRRPTTAKRRKTLPTPCSATAASNGHRCPVQAPSANEHAFTPHVALSRLADFHATQRVAATRSASNLAERSSRTAPPEPRAHPGPAKLDNDRGPKLGAWTSTSDIPHAVGRTSRGKLNQHAQAARPTIKHKRSCKSCGRSQWCIAETFWLAVLAMFKLYSLPCSARRGDPQAPSMTAQARRD